MSDVSGHESLVGDAAYFTGTLIVWYKTPEAAKHAVELFHEKKLGTYKDILSFETQTQNQAGNDQQIFDQK